MKVAHLVSTYPPYRGGMGNVAAQFAEALARRHSVTVFTPGHGAGAPTQPGTYRVEWMGTPVKMGNAAWLPQLVWRLRSFDVVHLHYPFFGSHLPVWAGCFLSRSKLVLQYHMDSVAAGLRGALFASNRRAVLPLLARRADRIIGSSLDYLSHSHLASYYRAHSEKFREVPFWVDTDKFRPRTEEAGGETVLFVGGLDRAHYFKGLEVLLRATQEVVRKSDRRVSLRVVGGGDLLPYYENLARELGISDQVKFLGKLDDSALACVYRDSSFLVLPSINQVEAFGLVLLEAMSSGKPVIASNLPGVRTVFRDGKEGFVVRVADVDDLAEKMLRLTEDEELRGLMGRNARAWVEEKYTAEHAARALEAVYEELAPGRRGC